jgi:L-2-hydroxycarboxylate dehydrogenase (NAD+)
VTQRASIVDLRRFAEAVLTSYGVREEDARTTALRMLEADLRGQSGHGIFRLPAYAQRLDAAGYNLSPDVRAVHETPVSAVVDGDNGLGQVVVTYAAELAIEKAKANGLAWVGTRRSNHAGAGGVYASMALEHDLIAIYMAIGNANHLPPWGGTDLLLSTNPIAAAIPAGDEPPIVLDMATTVASYGRIKVAAERGETIPEGWLEDREGRPLTDPQRASEGFLLPIGGYKGYGLNLVIGALAGVLNGAAFGSQVIDFNADFHSPTNTGQTLIVARPDLFRPLDEFRAAMDERIREIRASTPMPGRDPVRIPGDQTDRRRHEMEREGVPLADGTVARLIDLAERTDTPHPFS